MAQSANPPHKKIRIAFNKRVNGQFGIEPVYKYRSINQIGRYNPEGYECTVCIGDKVICTNRIFRSKFEAASQTAKLGFSELILPADDESTQANKKSKIKKIEKAEVGWIHAKDLENVYKNLSEDILATQFKDILEQYLISGSKREAQYGTQLHTDGGITGYTSYILFNGKTYKSLGPMLSEEQAEQSAAEICLRSIGGLPLLENPDTFIIQPYLGGTSKRFKGSNPRAIPPHIYSTTSFSDMLHVYLSCHYMQHPRYYTKKLESQFDEEEIGDDGKRKQKFDCICCFEGKVFKAKYPHVMPIVKEFAAMEALKYLGISHPIEKLWIKKIACVYRYDFLAKSSLSPFHQSPSKQKGWTTQRFCRNENYDDSTGEALFSSGIITPNLKFNGVYMQELVSKELSRKPSFKIRDLFTIKDLVIAEVDPKNPNLFLIGNSEFSIKMLCEGGKIYSGKRKYDVELLPGHNILKLNCHYKVTLPSLEVYLKGVDCDDVTFPNPPLPVVTSCGTVVLFHDHQASRSDIYVILRKSWTPSTFTHGSGSVKVLLDKLITPFIGNTVTPAQCVEGIKSWQDTDVKLLSEMTMDSLKEFMSKCQQYDDRWNELFAKKSLPDNLIELQDLCLKEIQRREEEGPQPEEEIVKVPWTLPESEFISRFESVGINLEDSNKCAFRALLECQGNIRVKYGDIDNCPKIDLPVEDEEKQHRGDIMRYYIWKGCQRVTGDEKVTYFDQLDADELPHEEGWEIANLNAHTSFNESGTKILKDERPHGFPNLRQKYFQGVYFQTPNVDANDEGKEVIIETNGDIAVKQDDEVEPTNDEEKETGTIDAEEEKEVPEVNEPMTVDEPVTDEYGTIGETAESRKKNKPAPRATRATRSRNATKEQEDVDEPMKDEEDTAVDEVKESEEEVTNTEADEQIEGEDENKDIAEEEEVANGKADESMEDIAEEEEVANGKADESMEDNDALDEKAATFRKYKANTIAWADDKDVVLKKRIRKPKRFNKNRGRVDIANVRRMALRENCVWMKLDEAVDACPMLKKISVMPQFQNQIKLLIAEANSFMESKGMSEKVETSVLLDDE